MGGGWGDVAVQALAGVIGISHAYIMHRFVTYRSKGVWWREYFRFYIVYGLQIALQAGLFFVFSTWLGFSGYITQLVLCAFFTIVSYKAHRDFSFRQTGSK